MRKRSQQESDSEQFKDISVMYVTACRSVYFWVVCRAKLFDASYEIILRCQALIHRKVFWGRGPSPTARVTKNIRDRLAPSSTV